MNTRPERAHLRKAPNWTEPEKNIVRELYAQGWRVVAAALPLRTKTAILKMACALGVTVKAHYSRSEDLALGRLWESGIDLDAIAGRMGRSLGSVYDRALKIGLKAAVPRGFECLTAAAERTGFVRESLSGILRWAGVKRHLALSDPAARKKEPRWHRYYYDPVSVDDAVAAWMSTETLRAAARARDLRDFTLRRWLIKAGAIEPRVYGPRSRGRRPRWRVPTDVIDRVIAERQKKKAA